MHILFLYTELADYTIACLKELKQSAQDNTIMVIHFPVNPEAPFRFDFGIIGSFHCISDFKDYSSLKQLILQFDPEKIVCSGWINKWYLRICKHYSNKSLCILTIDNHWENSLKQQLLKLMSVFTLRTIFKKVWVPGDPQTEYALKIGFKEKDITTGFYCCDIDRFNALYQKFRDIKKHQFPHRFLCVARYIHAKGYENLWKAFIEWKKHSPNDWQLWCAGTGEQFEQRVEHPDIKHLGFVQKDEWDDIIRQTGVFILPSEFEPWGVVVHEFAAAGYPLLLSNKVGAGSQFLTSENGWQFVHGNTGELIRQFQAINDLGTDRILEMGNISHQLAQRITPAKWASTLLHL